MGACLFPRSNSVDSPRRLHSSGFGVLTRHVRPQSHALFLPFACALSSCVCVCVRCMCLCVMRTISHEVYFVLRALFVSRQVCMVIRTTRVAHISSVFSDATAWFSHDSSS